MDVETNTKQNFYARFHESHAALETQIELLPSISPTERPEAIDRCLAAISTLSDVVKDASSYLPAYDQRSYSGQIRGLSDKLSETRKAITPTQKFSFKSKGKDIAAAIGGAMKSSTSSSSTPQTESTTPASDQLEADNLTISSLIGKYTAYTQPPASSSSSSLLLSDISTSIILFPTTKTPLFSSAAVKNVTNTLLFLSGAINGPIHLTSLSNTTILVACRQFRMHDAENVDVYLLCSSRPIIENCWGIRFAPLDVDVGGEWESVKNLWDQVDDFKWLKSGHSPNWEVMGEEVRIGRGGWEGVGAWGIGDGNEEREEKAVREVLRKYVRRGG
ncbi:tubulin binding cofactor C-domain-containing protein [Tuber brumale]|nr:tubulin binding cofactor C-domain-containing protein [Tuber brumale]